MKLRSRTIVAINDEESDDVINGANGNIGASNKTIVSRDIDNGIDDNVANIIDNSVDDMVDNDTNEENSEENGDNEGVNDGSSSDNNIVDNDIAEMKNGNNTFLKRFIWRLMKLIINPQMIEIRDMFKIVKYINEQMLIGGLFIEEIYMSELEDDEDIWTFEQTYEASWKDLVENGFDYPEEEHWYYTHIKQHKQMMKKFEEEKTKKKLDKFLLTMISYLHC